VQVGGIVAQNDDFVSAVYGSFPLKIALIAVLTSVLLARAFRSLLLPAKAVLLNVLSVAGAWGVVTLVWQHGYGADALWGIPAAGSIPSWLPLMVFAFLYGLSMDYEVFILAGLREAYDRSGSTETAVVEGIGNTGRLVTSAALILFLGFVAMATAPDTSVKMIATGLGAGILLDATIVRASSSRLPFPLFGRWNWWLPQPIARALRVDPNAPEGDPDDRTDRKRRRLAPPRLVLALAAPLAARALPARTPRVLARPARPVGRRRCRPRPTGDPRRALRTRRDRPRRVPRTARSPRRPLIRVTASLRRRQIAAVLCFVSATLAAMSALHLGGVLADGTEPFDPTHAGVAEALICIAVAFGAVSAARGSTRAPRAVACEPPAPGSHVPQRRHETARLMRDVWVRAGRFSPRSRRCARSPSYAAVSGF
jgi:hypothetical protein